LWTGINAADHSDPRTWDKSNVAKYRMLLTQGSTGPPCDRPLDLAAGRHEHAPVVGGRKAEVNVYCGGCPDWPTDWAKQPLVGGETDIFNQYCSRYKQSLAINNGRPRSVNPVTNEAVTVVDTKACVCNVSYISDCEYHFDITASCPAADIAFNEAKRFWLFIGTSVLTIVVLWVYLTSHFRYKQKRFGKKYALLEGFDRAAHSVVGTGTSLVKNSLTIVAGDDVIPGRPARA